MFILDVAVVEARCLPGMTTDDQCSPFVTVELCPLTMFPVTSRHQTKVRIDTISPLFEEKFEL
jgi:C2 domain